MNETETATITRKIQKIESFRPMRQEPLPDDGRLFAPNMVHGETHPGLVRSENQDSFACSVSDDGNMAMLLVADGIGGNEGGDLASHYIAEMLLRDFRKFQQDGKHDRETVLAFLRSHVILAHCALRNLNMNFNVLHPMGTTLAMVILLPDAAITAHAGDSRVYCLRDGNLFQYTQDHSVINDLINLGKLTPAQAKKHPMNHVISQSMGICEEVKPDFNVYERHPGDRFLVCSDGLMLHVSDMAIRDIMTAASSARQAVRNLITRNLRGGGGDNVTAVCAYPVR